MSNYYQFKNNVNDGSAYLVSGKPYATGSLSIPAIGTTKVEFPEVTRWIYIANRDSAGSHRLRVAFTEAGLTDSSLYFEILADENSGILELRTNEIWLRGDTGTVDPVDVVAGLTSIPSSSLL